MNAPARLPQHRRSGIQWLRDAMILLCLAVIPGCGPTAGQIFTYEIVLVVVGLAMGLAMWALGRRIGRRWCRWFVCSHCLRPQPANVQEPQMQQCPSCGQLSSVNYLSRKDMAELTDKKHPRVCWASHKRTAAWALLLAVATIGVFALVSVTLNALWSQDNYPWPTKYENWILFPLTLVASEPSTYPGVSCGLLFYNFHAFCFACEALDFAEEALGSVLLETVLVSIVYIGLVSVLALHWYAGLRRWRRGWLLPIVLQSINIVLAALGYFFKWH